MKHNGACITGRRCLDGSNAVIRATLRFFVILSGLILSFALSAEQLTVSSLIELKALGFTDVEIKEQVVRSGEAVALNQAGIEELKRAGFSEDLIRFLEQPPPVSTPPVTSPPSEQPGGTGQEQLPPASTPAEPANRPEPQHRPPPITPNVTPPAAPTYPRGLVLDIQHYLNMLGYDAGSEDGILGRQTQDAIRRFQNDSGIRADGVPSTALLAELIARTQQQSAPAQGLAGGWYSTFSDDYGVTYEMYLDLFPDGTFSTSSQSATGAYAEAYGNYTVRGQELIMQNQMGAVQSYRFRMSGQKLIVRLPGVSREVVLSRYQSELQ
jgi:hypothetical protein